MSFILLAHNLGLHFMYVFPFSYHMFHFFPHLTLVWVKDFDLRGKCGFGLIQAAEGYKVADLRFGYI